MVQFCYFPVATNDKDGHTLRAEAIVLAGQDLHGLELEKVGSTYIFKF